MGGNVAYEIAKKELSEAVVGATSRETGALFRKLFQTPYFNVDVVQDVVGGSASACTPGNIWWMGFTLQIIRHGVQGQGLGRGRGQKVSIIGRECSAE